MNCRYWKPEWIIEACQDWAAIHGGPPLCDQWAASPGPMYPSASTVKKRFGTWNAMIEAAGFTPTEARYGALYWTCDRMVAACHRWVQENGRIPTARDWGRASTFAPPSSSVLSRFGSWNAMILAAGYEPREPHSPKRWTKDKVAAAMLDWLLRTGRWPTRHEWQARVGDIHRPSASTVEAVFGSWDEGKRFAGWDGRNPRAKVAPYVEPRCGECGTELDNQTLGCLSCGDRVRKRAERATKSAPAASGQGSSQTLRQNGSPSRAALPTTTTSGKATKPAAKERRAA